MTDPSRHCKVCCQAIVIIVKLWSDVSALKWRNSVVIVTRLTGIVFQEVTSWILHKHNWQIKWCRAVKLLHATNSEFTFCLVLQVGSHLRGLGVTYSHLQSRGWIHFNDTILSERRPWYKCDSIICLKRNKTFRKADWRCLPPWFSFFGKF